MKHFIYSLLFFTLIINTHAQDKNQLKSDSLMSMKYKDLRDSIYEYSADYEKAKIYAKTYLLKAKRDKNITKIGQGYYYHYGIINDFDKKLIYLDSVIQVTKKKPNKVFPTKAYLRKAYLYHFKRDYQKAIENYSIALNLAIKNKNITKIYRIKFSIGLFKSAIGEYEEALSLYKECYQISLSENYKKNSPIKYLRSINAIADTYNRIKNTDSASYYNKLGYFESVSLHKKDWTSYATYTEGINQFHLKNYQAAIDSLSKSIPILKTKDFDNLAEAYYNIGMSYFSIKNEKEGIKYLIKMDSLVHETNYSYYELRKGYEVLINHYKTKNKTKKQLELRQQFTPF